LEVAEKQRMNTIAEVDEVGKDSLFHSDRLDTLRRPLW
jgi:hypothetical protein